MDEDMKESERVERRKTSATPKRLSAMASIRAVHAMVFRIKTESEFIPEFSLNVDGSDRLWSHFETEDNMVF